MTSARKAFASRANGRKSRGPKTADGKARSLGHAKRHGMSVPLLADPTLAPDVDALARRIIRSVLRADSDPGRYELACRIAEAQLDIARVRKARLPLLKQVDADPKSAVTVVPELLRLDRYERRALARRKFAIREFDTAAAPVVAAGKMAD